MKTALTLIPSQKCNPWWRRLGHWGPQIRWLRSACQKSSRAGKNSRSQNVPHYRGSSVSVPWCLSGPQTGHCLGWPGRRVWSMMIWCPILQKLLLHNLQRMQLKHRKALQLSSRTGKDLWKEGPRYSLVCRQLPMAPMNPSTTGNPRKRRRFMKYVYKVRRIKEIYEVYVQS